MKTFITTILILANLNNAFSQSGLKYNVVAGGGLLVGNNQSGSKAELLQGIKFEDWTFGIGAAWDNYVQKSFPLYAEIKRFVLPGKMNPFIYGSAGFNLVQKKFSDEEWQSSYNKPGTFYEGGAGVKFKEGKINLFLSAGYSHKSYTKHFDTKNLPPSTDINWRTELYKFNRYTIKLGIGN